MSLIYIENNVVRANPDRYQILQVDTDKILASWKESLFSFEWLMPDGSLRSTDNMQEAILAKFNTVKEKIEKHEEINRPVLGVGLIDNVEIGSGKDVFLTLAAHNIKEIEVHILQNDKDFFESFKSE